MYNVANTQHLNKLASEILKGQHCQLFPLSILCSISFITFSNNFSL